MTIANARWVDLVRSRWALVVCALGVGALVGGAAGAGLAMARPQMHVATAIIGVVPAAQNHQDGSGHQNDVTVMGELIIIGGPAMRSQVQRRVGKGDPVSYAASQVGASNLVSVTAEATSLERGMASVEAVLEAYTSDREKRLRGELDRSAQIVDAELSRLRQELGSQPLGSAALEQEYGRLLSLRSNLFRAAASVDRAVTVVQSPQPGGAGLSPVSRHLLVGTVAGGLAGVGLLMLVDRLRRRVQSQDELADAGIPLIEPSIASHPGYLRAVGSGGSVLQDLRLLAAQLARPGGGGVLVLFGATPGVGTSFLATATAACLAERSDVLLVLAADVVSGSDGGASVGSAVADSDRGLTTAPDRPLTANDIAACSVDSVVPGVWVLRRGPGHSDGSLLRRLLSNGLLDACAATGRTVVVDAPALSESGITIDIAHAASKAALVVGDRVTSRAEVRAVARLFEAHGIPLVGAVFNRPRRSRRKDRRHDVGPCEQLGLLQTDAFDAPPQLSGGAGGGRQGSASQGPRHLKGRAAGSVVDQGSAPVPEFQSDEPAEAVGGRLAGGRWRPAGSAR